MMTEMVDRVAEAIRAEMARAAAGTRFEGVLGPYERDMARAAIEAMLVPTEAMQVAGAGEDVAVARTAEGDYRCLTPSHVWRAMVMAALG